MGGGGGGGGGPVGPSFFVIFSGTIGFGITICSVSKMFRLPPVYSRLSLERRRSKRSVGSSEATKAGRLGFGRGLVNAREEPVLRGAVAAGVIAAAGVGLAAEDRD